MKKYALSLTSAFTTPSMLKARIVMLYRKPSARIALAKFGFVLPVLGLCVVINACMQREMPLVQQKAEKSPRVIWLKNKQGEMVETIHFDGEKDNYEKVADKIGLNDFLKNKDTHTIAEIRNLYEIIFPTALANQASQEEAQRMQDALFSVLLQKDAHKTTDMKQVAFMTQGLIKHPYSAYYFLGRQENIWFQETLPKLKKYWSETKFKECKQQLLTVFKENAKGIINPKPTEIQEIIQIIENL
jgi:hypothetical protein